MRIYELSVVFALAGAVVQIYWRVQQYRYEQQALAQDFTAVRQLMEEVKWSRPLRRLRRRREVMDLLDDRPKELFDYRRVYWDVVAWALILVAGLYGVGDALTERFVS